MPVMRQLSFRVFIDFRNVCLKHAKLNRKICDSFSQISSRHWRMKQNHPVVRGIPLLSGVVLGISSVTIKSLMSQKYLVKCEAQTFIPEDVTVVKNLKKDVSKSARRKTRDKSVKFLDRLVFVFQISFRTLLLCCLYSPFLVSYPLTLLSSHLKTLWWRALLCMVELSGPAFIKLGQWASTRRDLFSEEFCDRFSKLYRRVTPHSWYYTKRKLEKSFGKKWRNALKFENKKPVGSGCIAQVYKAYIKPEAMLDQSLAEELLQEQDDSDTTRVEVDFAEGIEILGFGQLLSRNDSDDTDDSKDCSEAKSEEIAETSTEFHERSGRSDNTEDLIQVAIKVLHPGVYRHFKRDIYIMKCMASTLEFLFERLRWLSLRSCVDEFSDFMEKQADLVNLLGKGLTDWKNQSHQSQMDMRLEAKALERLIDNFSSNPNIKIPMPIRPFVKRDILVETFEEGEDVSNFMTKDTDFPDGLKQEIASIGVDALLQMVFSDNFVHADLHPGNIMVKNVDLFQSQFEEKVVLHDVGDTFVVGGTHKPPESPLQLVFVDVGLFATLKPEDRPKFLNVFTAVAEGEGEKVAELFLTQSPGSNCQNAEQFTKEMSALVGKFRSDAVSLKKVHIGSLLTEVFGLLIKHRIKLESNFSTIILAIAVLEGIGRSLDPEIDILERAKPYLLSNIKL